MREHASFQNRKLFLYLLIVMLLSAVTSGHAAETVTIGSPPTWTMTQNLNALYTAAGGSGDLTARVSGVVDVPATQGTAVKADNIEYEPGKFLWTLTNTGIIRGDSGVDFTVGGTVINQNEITARALNGSGIYLGNGGGANSVTNQTGGVITAGISAAVGGIGVNLVGSPTKNVVDNYGQIYAYGDATNSRGTAVLLHGGGSVTIHNVSLDCA